MFRWAVPRGHVDSDPTALVERPGTEQRRERALRPNNLKTFWAGLDSIAYSESVKIAQNKWIVDSFEAEYETVSHLTIDKAVKLIRERESKQKIIADITDGWEQANLDIEKLNAELNQSREMFSELGGDDEFQKWTKLTKPTHKKGGIFGGSK